jgi:tRNA G10  N-methylase Trm11
MVNTCDATKVSELVGKEKIAAVVTECTLGPIYGQYPKETEIQKNFEDLTKLYKASLTEFSKFLPQKGRVVMCIPAYKKGRNHYQNLQSLDFVKELGYTFVSLIPSSVAKKYKFLKLTDRGTAIYDRKDQVVAREIVIFEKN